MIEQAIFNEWIAEELIARGYALTGRSRLAWFFEDSSELERTIAELTALVEKL
jgi:ubiquinone biosynthesis protein UbiJ